MGGRGIEWKGCLIREFQNQSLPLGGRGIEWKGCLILSNLPVTIASGGRGIEWKGCLIQKCRSMASLRGGRCIESLKKGVGDSIERSENGRPNVSVHKSNPQSILNQFS